MQSNLCTTTTPKLRPLLTGVRYSEVDLCYSNLNWDFKIVVGIRSWSLAQV
jgi:hypothetical protein